MTFDAFKTNCSFDSFSSLSEVEINKIIKQSPSKSCDLDPLPTSLLKENMSSILPLITEIVNDSLSSGHVPEEFKVAHVTPLLKNTSLDKNVLKNYRPVSNLPFVSKVLERAVAKQLRKTALLCVQNDIVQAIDGNKSVILVLLDLSAAFDTIDHTVLLHRLKHDFGITGTALKWLDSYLSHRTQTVKIGDSFSTKQKLLFGVPQGSVLGPVLFSLYSSPVAKIARKYSLCVQLYAYDTQLYLSFTPCE